MSGAYPQFQPSYSHEELVEHFLLGDENEKCTRSVRNRLSASRPLLRVIWVGLWTSVIIASPAEEMVRPDPRT